MAIYFANQIILGKLNYTDVCAAKPALKPAIDAFLIEKNRQDLIIPEETV